MAKRRKKSGRGAVVIKGANGKRLNYFLSAMFRGLAFLGLIIAYIVVKITVKPGIEWLNILLLCLSLGGLVSGIFNLILCGFTATGYKENFWVQLICLIVTCLTGGIVGTTLTSVAFACKVTDEEVKNENVIRLKK